VRIPRALTRFLRAAPSPTPPVEAPPISEPAGPTLPQIEVYSCENGPPVLLSEWCQEAPGDEPRGLYRSEYSLYLSRFQRADERTRTADLTSLPVIIHALQGFAQACKYPISKPLSFLCLALCCTVLRSRWYQSGIKRSLGLGTSGVGSPWITRLAGYYVLDRKVGMGMAYPQRG
jgi:hypothetical protein